MLCKYFSIGILTSTSSINWTYFLPGITGVFIIYICYVLVHLIYWFYIGAYVAFVMYVNAGFAFDIA